MSKVPAVDIRRWQRTCTVSVLGILLPHDSVTCVLTEHLTFNQRLLIYSTREFLRTYCSVIENNIVGREVFCWSPLLCEVDLNSLTTSNKKSLIFNPKSRTDVLRAYFISNQKSVAPVV